MGPRYGSLASPSCFLAGSGTPLPVSKMAVAGAWPVMESPSAMAAAVDPIWEDDEEEEEEEEIEVVSGGQRPAAPAVLAEPPPGREGSLGCGQREGGGQTTRWLSESREAVEG